MKNPDSIKPKDDVNIVIIKQGGPVLNGGFVTACGPDIVAISIDMQSKRCCDLAYSQQDDGTPAIIILADKYSLYLKEGLEDQHTEIAFPEYTGFRVFLANVSRYTLDVCLVREEDHIARLLAPFEETPPSLT